MKKLIWVIILLVLTANISAQTKNLAGYFGFDTIEHIKMHSGITPPIITDINGNGLMDMLVIDNSQARIDILLQKKDFDPHAIPEIKPEDGKNINDIFGRELTWRFKRVSYPLNYAVLSVAVADMNDDGLADLIYVAREGLFVTLQKNSDPEKLTVNWHEPVKYETEEVLESFYSLNTGDFNNDGKTDIVLTVRQGAYIFLQGDDGLENPTNAMVSSDNVRRIYVADINGNGKDDILYLVDDREHPLRVRFQINKGQLGPENYYKLPAPAALEVAQLGSKQGRIVYVQSQSGRVALASIDMDESKTEFPVFVLPLSLSDGRKSDIISADLDGNGIKDLIASDTARAEFVVFQGSKTNTFSKRENYPGLKDMVKLVAADTNRNGKDEIIALSIEEKIIGISSMAGGRLSYPKTISLKGEPKAMAMADINGNGFVDLVYIAEDKDDDGKRVYYLRYCMNDNGQFKPSDNELLLQAVKDPPRDIVCCDINNDGKGDVIIFRPFEPPVLVTGGKEYYGGALHGGLIENAKPDNVSFGPLGENGGDAILLAQGKFSRALNFDNEKGWHVIDQYQATNDRANITTVVAKALDGHKLSLICFDAGRNRLVIMDRQQDGTYDTSREIELGNVEVKKILADNFGGDSETSILVCTPRQVYRLPLVANTHKLNQVLSFEPDSRDLRLAVLAVGDINNNGIPEIVLGDHNTNAVVILAFDAQAELVQASRLRIYENPRGQSDAPGRARRIGGNPRSIAISDVTGDGKNDLIMLVNDRILIYPQD